MLHMKLSRAIEYSDDEGPSLTRIIIFYHPVIATLIFAPSNYDLVGGGATGW